MGNVKLTNPKFGIILSATSLFFMGHLGLWWYHSTHKKSPVHSSPLIEKRVFSKKSSYRQKYSFLWFSRTRYTLSISRTPSSYKIACFPRNRTTISTSIHSPNSNLPTQPRIIQSSRIANIIYQTHYIP